MTYKKLAVILSGCGNMDGAEITESILTLLKIDESSAKAFMFAPDIKFSPIDHYTKKPIKESRNVLSEAARIARGEIWPLGNLKVQEFDALILPGGLGVAKTFSNLNEKGAACKVNPDIEQIILDFFKSGKPIGALCISPAIVAKVLQPHAPNLLVTLGDHNSTLNEIGVHQQPCTADAALTDEKNKIVTTPAFMLNAGLADIAKGVGKLIEEVIRLC